jgi:hypothetical protein
LQSKARLANERRRDEEAVPKLIEQPFDPDEFPLASLQAFGNKETLSGGYATGKLTNLM